MKRSLVLVKLMSALLFAAVAIPSSALAHHPPSYENWAEKLLQKDWSEPTGLARGTLTMLSDVIEAGRHGFGLLELRQKRHEHVAGCEHGRAGHVQGAGCDHTEAHVHGAGCDHDRAGHVHGAACDHTESHVHGASCSHGTASAGANVARNAVTSGAADACGCTPGNCHCPCGCPPTGCTCGAPSAARAGSAGFRRD